MYVLEGHDKSLFFALIILTSPNPNPQRSCREENNSEDDWGESEDEAAGTGSHSSPTPLWREYQVWG
jgi:hypothetical protein